MQEKSELLEEVATVYDNSGELDIHILVVTLLSMIIVLALVFPKIYIASNIYYESIAIQSLQKKYKILSEENRVLTQKIEAKRFISE